MNSGTMQKAMTTGYMKNDMMGGTFGKMMGGYFLFLSSIMKIMTIDQQFYP